MTTTITRRPAAGSHFTFDEVMALPVHPAAAAFPAFGRRGLRELADDIKINGLETPITLYDDPKLGVTVLDGVNRRDACKLVGVKPTVRWYTGDDPQGKVASSNLLRRHLTPGQRTALTVKLRMWPGRTQTEAAVEADVAQSAIGHAVVVLRQSPELLDMVIEGKTTMGAAYRIARQDMEGTPAKRPADVTSTPAPQSNGKTPVAAFRRLISDTTALIGGKSPAVIARRLSKTSNDIPTAALNAAAEFFTAAVAVRQSK